MKKFEHLFSQDPIGAFEKIEEDYKRYFDVSYKISNEEINNLSDELNDLQKETYQVKIDDQIALNSDFKEKP